MVTVRIGIGCVLSCVFGATALACGSVPSDPDAAMPPADGSAAVDSSTPADANIDSAVDGGQVPPDGPSFGPWSTPRRIDVVSTPRTEFSPQLREDGKELF